MAINWQGAVPESAAEFGRRFQTETRWQKYLAYEVLVRTGFKYTNSVTSDMLLDFDPKRQDSWKLSSQPWAAEEENDIRAKYSITSNAELFRRSLSEGTSIWNKYFAGTVRDVVDPFELFDFACDLVGSNSRWEFGIQHLDNNLDGYRTPVNISAYSAKSGGDLVPLSSVETPQFGRNYKVIVSDNPEQLDVMPELENSGLTVVVREGSQLVAQSAFQEWCNSLKSQFEVTDVSVLEQENLPEGHINLVLS